MNKKEKQYFYDIAEILNVIQNCLIEIKKQLKELEKDKE